MTWEAADLSDVAEADDVVDVAIIGGGPAGAITATLLARDGLRVVLLERSPTWRWRACGVFTSPAATAALRRVGLAESDLRRVLRPIPAMRVETRQGVSFRLTYGGSGSLDDSAVGIDRAALDALLLNRARDAGVEVRLGAQVERVELGPVQGDPLAFQQLILAGAAEPLVARLVVGADGLRSIVAHAAGVDRTSPLGHRVGLSFHLPDPLGNVEHDARMVIIDDGYAGLAPVPGRRVNVGIVLGRSWSEFLRVHGAAEIARGIVERLPSSDGAPALLWHPLDPIAGVAPLGHRVTRRGGEGWVLVGDAAGFLDPFTGEGLHRAFVSAALAAESIDRALGPRGTSGLSSLAEYEAAMRERFATKDLVSRLVQGFLARPALFEYAARRLAGREHVRETMGLVIGDLAPARLALGPRYLAELLAP
jgi:flavin-dependent dehydrogenase